MPVGLDELSDIVGSANVADDRSTLGLWSSGQDDDGRLRPQYVVQPRSAAEVQALVELANRTSTPLVPVSSGPPHLRGDSVPEAERAVQVDLRRLKQIDRIDRRNRVAMIGPGISFSELVPELRKSGLRLNLPLLPRANKSVIASMLEREPVIMPLYQWDAADPLTCLEVVFGTGETFRTGSAAGPGSLDDQWRSAQAQVNQMGPGQTDFARVVQGAQGTLGIVTWATVKCEAAPSRQKPFFVGSDRFEDLAELVYRLLWLKLGDECLILNRTDLAHIMAGDPGRYATILADLPRWILFFCLAGYEYLPDRRIEYQEKEMALAARELGLEPCTALAGIDAHAFLSTASQPSADPYWKLRPKGCFEDLFFLSTLDQVRRFLPLVEGVAERHGYPAADIGIYVQPMVQGTSCHCEFTLFFDPQSQERAEQVKKLHLEAVSALMDAGAFLSRPYGPVADLAYDRDPATASALKKVKRIFDPNQIMNPGKLCF